MEELKILLRLILIYNFFTSNIFVKCIPPELSVDILEGTKIPNKSMKIIEGQKAVIGEFPSQVSLQRFGIHFCGGTLISPIHVLTAAHCSVTILDFEIVNDDIFVVAGDTFLTNSDTESSATRGISKVYTHEDYNNDKTGFYSDIAILELKLPFDINENLRPIDIPSIEAKVPSEGVSCYITGWGATQKLEKDDDEDFLISSVDLLKAEVTIKSDSECKKIYEEEYFIPQMICAGDNKKDACHGDSGGPLICNGTVYGIISSGSGCGASEYPGVYTNLVHFRDWINTFLLKTDLNDETYSTNG